MKGVLTFWSETGTEGGYWAFQDESAISRVPAGYGIWGDTPVWDQASPERQGRTQPEVFVLHDGEWLPLPDPMQQDPDYFLSSLFRGQNRGDRDADERLAEKYGLTFKYSDQEYGTPLTEPQRPYGTGPGDITKVVVDWSDGTSEERLSDSLLVESWDYNGLKVLKDGDRITIYEKQFPERVLWEGEIKLKPHKLFTASVRGMWIHADMEGWEREKWAELFFDSYPAEFEPTTHFYKEESQ